MAYEPKYLNLKELDAVYLNGLKQLESMHITGLIHERPFLNFGPGNWDPAKGEDMIQKVRDEWDYVRKVVQDKERET